MPWRRSMRCRIYIKAMGYRIELCIFYQILHNIDTQKKERECHSWNVTFTWILVAIQVFIQEQNIFQVFTRNYPRIIQQQTFILKITIIYYYELETYFNLQVHCSIYRSQAKLQASKLLWRQWRLYLAWCCLYRRNAYILDGAQTNFLYAIPQVLPWMPPVASDGFPPRRIFRPFLHWAPLP